MKNKFTIIDRLTSETPKFFKRMQLFGIGLVGLGASLAKVTGVPEKVTVALITAGGVIAAVSQFAVAQFVSIAPETKEAESNA
jgi:hypothetical protein